MGQLEKYGLYVLCLVVFLIFGVTIWGSGDVAAGGRSPVPMHAPGGGAGANLGRAAATPPPAGERSRSLDLLTTPPAPTPQNPPPATSRPTSGASPTAAGNANNGGPAGPAPATPPVPVAEVATTVLYTVQDGDSFGSIARTRLGKESLWPEIQQLNPEVQPHRLRAGKQIKLPTAAAIAARDSSRQQRAATPVAPVADAGRRYTVKKGDTIERIAINQLGSRKRQEELLALNPTVKPEKIRPGDTLALPAK
jgi:LysM repeat protein